MNPSHGLLRRAPAVLSILCLLGPPLAAAQDASQWASPASAGADLIWHETTTLTPIRLTVPKDFAQQEVRAMVIALHGYGESAVAFQRVTEPLAAAGLMVALPEATYAMFADTRAGFDWALNQQDDPQLRARALRLLVRHLPGAVAEIRKAHAVDKVYVLGFSQGAMVALLTAIYGDRQFDGVVTFGLPAFDPAWVAFEALASAGHVRVLLAHGARDKVAPSTVSKQAQRFLAGAGFESTLRSFPGGHEVPSDELVAVARWIRDGAAGKPAQDIEEPP